MPGYPDPARDTSLIPGSRYVVLLPGSLKGTDQIAGFQFLREQDHLLAGLAELLDVLVHDAAELGLQHRVFLALAVGPKAHRADDGLHLMLMKIFCDRLLVERAHRLDRRLDELAAGVAERREIIAERIDLGLNRALGIFVEELLGPFKIHFRFREP